MTQLTAYGLTMSPFEVRALDPLQNPADLASVSQVDGWRHLTDAENLIGQRVAADKPVYFIVAGASSTGRSSVANYLVHLWARAWGVSSDAVVVHTRDPGPGGGVYDAGTQIMEWAQDLLFSDKQLDLTLSTQQLLTDLEATSKNLLFAQSLRAVDEELRRPEAGSGKGSRYLAAILEHGKGDDLMLKVRECFKGTRAIVIVTVDRSHDNANLLSQVDQGVLSGAGLRINVGPISGEDVKTLIEHRWSAVCPGVLNPFDLTAAAGVFNSARPIARVVDLLERMLWIRQHLHRGKPWPAERSLGFDRDQMAGLLQQLDTTVPVGQEW
jgi:hypothetical protein